MGAESDADLENRFAPPAFDESGRGGRIAVRIGYAFRSLTNDSMETLLETEMGERDSLRDDSGIVNAASVAVDAGAYALWVSDTPPDVQAASRQIANTSRSGANANEITATLKRAAPLDPYEVVAAGWGVDSGLAFTVIALAHSDAEAANRNAALLSSRLRTGPAPGSSDGWNATVKTAEIGVTGNVLVARLLPYPSQSLYNMNLERLVQYLAVTR